MPYEVFQASDGYFAFAAGNDRQWTQFCEAVDRSDWVTDERFATNPARLSNREELVPLLNELFESRTINEWIALCEEIGLPAGPINSMEDVLSHPQIQARDMVQHVLHPVDGDVKLLGSPMNIPTAPAAPRLAPPMLGQHTDEVLEELLGYTAEKVERLRAEGAV